jgi:hypothetical protein
VEKGTEGDVGKAAGTSASIYLAKRMIPLNKHCQSIRILTTS